jgi:phospholipase C
VIRRTALAATCAVMLAAGATAPAVGAADSGAVPHLRAPRACGRTPRQRPRIRHVIVIVLENHPAPAIIGHAPFITSLAHRCGYAARYHHNAKVSLPNYLAMTSGSIHGLRRDCMPKECPIRGSSIFTQLAHHGKKWRVYQESMPGRCARRRGSTPPATTRRSITGGSATGNAESTSSRSARELPARSATRSTTAGRRRTCS